LTVSGESYMSIFSDKQHGRAAHLIGLFAHAFFR
jgi:hypothetical protein